MNSIAKTAVTYNRSARQWEARNGTVTTFAPGPDGRRQALLTALRHDRPELASVVDDIAAIHGDAPAVVDRLIKAAQLVSHGQVFDNDRVGSQTDPDAAYHVSFDGCPKVWSCDCPDFENGLARQAGQAQHGGIDTDYGLMCKHSLARLLADFAGVDAQPQVIPWTG